MTTLIEFAHKSFLDFLRYFSIFSLLQGDQFENAQI